jgi:hypothetical protein
VVDRDSFLFRNSFLSGLMNLAFDHFKMSPEAGVAWQLFISNVFRSPLIII